MSRFNGLRVVHAANYQFDKDGARFFNPDHKIHQGMVQNNCYVYPFSINDRARMASFLCSKTFGKNAANKALVRTCKNIQPDVLILGHAQYISRESILQIRDQVPGIRIGFWYVDPLWEQAPTEHIRQRADLFDAICCTTGGPLLAELARPNCPAAFLPNPVDPSIERLRAFENKESIHDLLFIGRAAEGSPRGEILQYVANQLADRQADLRVGYYGCLGRPDVFGTAKDKIVGASRMAINLSRRNDIALYSSDRIAQWTGNGLCTLVQSGGGMEELYDDHEVVFFDGAVDLVQTILELASDDDRLRTTARNGWMKAHEQYSAKCCTAFLLDLLMGHPEADSVPWARHIYRWEDSLQTSEKAA
jgi:hypothetical protein